MNFQIENIYTGMPLLTKDPDRLTNAVLVSKVNEKTYTVLSDFGNLMRFTLSELNELYYLKYDPEGFFKEMAKDPYYLKDRLAAQREALDNFEIFLNGRHLDG